MAYYTDFGQIPRDQYRVILADPPWTYTNKAQAGERGACFKYPLLTNRELAALDVSSRCTTDATCFLWATYPTIDSGLATLRAWGFRYHTVAFTWVKLTKLGKRYHWGMGSWTRANAEIVLLGSRGKPRRVSAGVHSIIEAPVGPHSRKPQEARDRIVTLMGDATRLELFARGESPGWDSFGNTPSVTL